MRVLKRHVPPAVPGIAFLSGGQSPTEATLHLSLMNQLRPLPWSLTFSYGRALQDTALKAWGGAAANFSAGQKEFARRAKLNGLATTGRYAPTWRVRPPEHPGACRARVTNPATRNRVGRPAADAVVDVRDVHYAIGGRHDILQRARPHGARRGRITASHGTERHRQDHAAAADHRADRRRPRPGDGVRPRPRAR